MTREIDPFQREVMWSHFDAIADAMAVALMRTAYSGIVRDSLDFSTALCNAKGDILAQGLCTPMQLGSFPDFIATLIGRYSGDIAPQDVFIANDPYAANGQHLPDIYIVMPIHKNDTLVGWAMTIAHHSDVGGIVPGSNSIGVEEIYQEGLRIPILKYRRRGSADETLKQMICLNVRLPDKVMGDIEAQVSACAIGCREMTALIDRYGVDVVEEYGLHLQDHAEELARAEIAALPDGAYTFEDHIDGIGASGEPIVLRVSVVVDNSEVVVDWTGSSDQVKGGINPTFPFTKACAYVALRSIMSSKIPNTDGFARAVHVRAPRGSIMNPNFPAPCGGRGITGFRMIDCLFGALAKIAPNRVAADGSGGSMLPTISGIMEGRPFIFCETFMGTWGATAVHDGQDGVSHLGANQSNVPVETIEAEYPIRIVQYGYVCDSGGAGQFRGGLGIVRDYEVLCDHVKVGVRADKRRFPPHGILGGHPGRPADSLVIRANGQTESLPILMQDSVELYAGDVYRAVLAGGGGYGKPEARTATAVECDIRDGRVSLECARQVYGYKGKPPSFSGAGFGLRDIHSPQDRNAAPEQARTRSG